MGLELRRAKRVNTIGKGRIAEAKVIAELVGQGWDVYQPIFGNGPCDHIACRPGHMVRIETKYVGAATASGSYEVSLRQVRANQSTTVVKRFNSEQSDFLGVYVAPLDEVIFFPAGPLHNATSVTVTAQRLKAKKSLLVLAEKAGVEPARPARP